MSSLIPTTPAEAVANGAQLLDDRYPGWWRHINLETLNVHRIDRCICGQLDLQYNQGEYPNWSAFSRRLTGNEEHQNYGFRAMPHHWTTGPSGWGTAVLDLEWKLAIRARLAADKLPAVAPRKEAVLA